MSSILTVSQLNRYVGFKIKSDVKLHGVAVKGEISNLSVNYKSGHVYFSLKDEESVVKAVLFSSNASKVKFNIENGVNVVAFGNIDVYERDGVYQIVVNELQPIGLGAVHNQLEELKKKLSQMGVFDQSIKRRIETCPQKIAVVTSSTGAALQDIINVISRRYPVCEVKVFPTLVQGVDAPEMISKALFNADREEADTIILARGGGSSEDLKAFNTEKVVLAVYNCSTPVISAVGHETDTTLADYAADYRAPTPSAAAEIAVPDMTEILGEIDRRMTYVKFLVKQKISSYENLTLNFEKKIKSFSPVSQLERNISLIDKAYGKIVSSFKLNIEKLDKLLVMSASKLSALNPFAVMERGYGVVLKNGEAVKSSDELVVGDKVNLKLLNGDAEAEILNVNGGNYDV